MAKLDPERKIAGGKELVLLLRLQVRQHFPTNPHNHVHTSTPQLCFTKELSGPCSTGDKYTPACSAQVRATLKFGKHIFLAHFFLLPCFFLPFCLVMMQQRLKELQQLDHAFILFYLRTAVQWIILQKHFQQQHHFIHHTNCACCTKNSFVDTGRQTFSLEKRRKSIKHLYVLESNDCIPKFMGEMNNTTNYKLLPQILLPYISLFYGQTPLAVVFFGSSILGWVMTLPCMFSCEASVSVSLQTSGGTRNTTGCLPSSVETQSVRPLALSLSGVTPPLLILTIPISPGLPISFHLESNFLLGQVTL